MVPCGNVSDLPQGVVQKFVEAMIGKHKQCQRKDLIHVLDKVEDVA